MLYINTEFNKARNIAYRGLLLTIQESKKQNNISEKVFQKRWIKKIQKTEAIIADGWYSPPPLGMAVLTDDINYPNRISFDSLRHEINWPSDKIINWETNLLYVYCSPVDIESGIPGDIAVTLYFGNNPLVKEHFRKTYRATHEVIKELPLMKNSQELFIRSQEIFEKYRLRNCVISKTDQTPLDLGHTLPQINNIVKPCLSNEQKVEISKARKFINGDSTWEFYEGMQFTIEPQLVSIDDGCMPQVSYHYVLEKKSDGFVLCNDVDSLIEEYHLK